jgi:hypothetical protein
MTWMTKPPIDGPILDELGAVSAGTMVEFDVTGAIAADGTYCFAIDSASTDGVTYNSREALTGQPQIEVTVEAVGVCGDGAINRPDEECDGADAPSCPGQCRTDCTCPWVPTSTTTTIAATTTTTTLPPPGCGDGTVNQLSEECDGGDDAGCPGACGIDCTCTEAAFCGDDLVNRAAEECDGVDATACPGACEANCTCPAPPICGDDDINQASEACDGVDAPSCPGACQADCTCAPPACGDNHVNQAAEDCDGADAAACPGRCQLDCTCDTTLPVGVVEADVCVRQNEPTQNFGAHPLLWVDADAVKQAFFRVRVRGVGAAEVLRATLHLEVAAAGGAESDSGGRIHPISACAWNEATMTYNTRPAIDGPVLDEIGAVGRSEAVPFDVTAAIGGDGTYCFAIDSLSSEGVEYISRETLAGRPRLDIVTSGVCGDGRVNQNTEVCDGIDDAACPAACLDDCTCALCGDGVTDEPAESCDGPDDDACAGQCGITCSCPDALPVPFACLADGGGDIILSGTRLEPYRNNELPSGTKIDARTATVVAFPDNGHPINLGGGTGGCFSGGAVLGQYDPTWTWEQMHDNFNNAGVAFANGSYTVDGVRVDNMTDGIRPRTAGAFAIRNVWLSHIRDDCIENDDLLEGIVDDSLLDGCYVGFSTRPSQENIDHGMNGSARVWTIQNTLVRLEAMPGPADGEPTELGHGGFFKWHLWNNPAQSLSPKLALYNNIFMAEQMSVNGSRMGTPPGQVLDCANNTMVWLGPGAFPGELPSCFTITTDRSVWDDAVADWHDRHPSVGW